VKTLLALVESPGHVCWRYRVAAFGPALEAAGWRVETAALERGVFPFLRQLTEVTRADAVLLQRRLLSWWQLRLLRRHAQSLFFDIDDAVFYRDSNSARGHKSGRRLRRFRATVRQCDGVLAGNHFLAEEARRWAFTDRVHYFPTCVDPGLYRPRPSERRGGDVRLVWIGSRSTMPSLDAIQPGLAEATRRLPGLTLRVVCDVFPTLAGVNVVPVSWSEATEANELANADIGISYLPEHPWSRGKCGLKVLQYMAAGLPVIANSYGVHPEMIEGGAGVLAGTSSKWADAIVRLAENAEIRRRMAVASRARVEAAYAVERWGQRLAQLLDAVMTRQQTRRSA
jgi:glycosyltransferase involved in cell wall biosynthesis